MKNKISLILFLSFSFLVNVAFADCPTVRIINVKDYGAKGDNKADDAPAFAKALDAAQDLKCSTAVMIKVPAGTYRLKTITTIETPALFKKAEKGIELGRGKAAGHIVLANMKNVCLAGEVGAHLIMTNMYHHGIAIYNCENTAVKNLTIDWDPIPFTQGKILESNPKKLSMVVEISKEFRLPTDPDFHQQLQARRMTIYNAETPTLDNALHAKYIKEMKSLGDRKFEMISRANVEEGLQGKRFVLVARRPKHAVRFAGSKNCMANAVTVYTAPGLAFNMMNCDNIIIRDCVIEPKPDSGRLLSTCADGVHCKFNRNGPIIDGCRFSGMDDDAINIGSGFMRICSVISPRELLVDNQPAYRPGDNISVINTRTGEIRFDAKVVDTILVKWRDSRAMRLILDRDVKVKATVDSVKGPTKRGPPVKKMGIVGDAIPDVIANWDVAGKDVIIRGNDFGNHRVRSILTKANGCLIENNTFHDIYGPSILLGSEYCWLEGPSSRNVIIRNNKFINIYRTNIHISDSRLDRTPSLTFDTNKNIEITGNTFSGYGKKSAYGYGEEGNVMYIANAEDVKIEGNTIKKSAPEAPQIPLITLGRCQNASIQGNKFVGIGRDVKELITIDKDARKDTIVVKDNVVE